MRIFNRLSSVIMSAAFVLSMTAAAVSASETDNVSETKEYTSGDFKYEINTENDDYYNESLYTENSIRITSYTGSAKELEIPEEIDGYTVTILGDYSFMDVSAEVITIPQTVSMIGSDCFFNNYNCKEYKVDSSNKYLKAEDGVLFDKDETILLAYPAAKTGETYVVPETVEIVASSSFDYTKLKSVELPEKLEYIGARAFCYNTVMESITLPENLEEIGDYAFAEMTSLSEVEFLTDKLTHIGSGSFADCSSLKEVEIPDGVTEIGQAAFLGTAMESVRIPPSVTTIGYSAFGYDKDFKINYKFVIYGKSGSMAESYATEEDSENDYKNQFKFIDEDAAAAVETGTSEEEKSGGISGKTVAYIVLGCIIAAGAAVLAILLALDHNKKKKSKKQDKKEK